MQCERTLFPALFHSNVSTTDIDMCPKMQRSKQFFKLINQLIKIGLLLETVWNYSYQGN